MTKHEDWRTARQIALDLAAELDAELRETDAGTSGIDINVTAPRWHVWSATETHDVVAHNLTSRNAAWQDITADMRYGIERCTEQDCEYCNDPDWEAAS